MATINLTSSQTPDLKYGRVVGQFLAFGGNSYGRTPDHLPETQKAPVTITIAPVTLLIPVGIDDNQITPFSLYREPIQLNVNDFGFLIDADKVTGVWLPVGSYKVTVATDQKPLESFVIEVTEAHTQQHPLDLTARMPVNGSQPTATLTYQQILDARDAALAALDGALTAQHEAEQAAIQAGQNHGPAGLSAADVQALIDAQYAPELNPFPVATNTGGSFDLLADLTAAVLLPHDEEYPMLRKSYFGPLHVTYGDGATEDIDMFANSDPFNVPFHHLYTAAGDYTVTVTSAYIAGPRAGQTATASVTVTVTAPVVVPPPTGPLIQILLPSSNVTYSTRNTRVGGTIDGELQNVGPVSINWGDGAVTTATVASDGTYTSTHKYTTDNTFTVISTVAYVSGPHQGVTAVLNQTITVYYVQPNFWDATKTFDGDYIPVYNDKGDSSTYDGIRVLNSSASGFDVVYVQAIGQSNENLLGRAHVPGPLNNTGAFNADGQFPITSGSGRYFTIQQIGGNLKATYCNQGGDNIFVTNITAH